MTITQEELKKQVSYDEKTGLFTRLISNSPMTKIGDIAGCAMPTGYLVFSVKGKQYYAHRLAWLYMTGELSTKQIDHKNGIKNDNRWANLRLATRFENQRNNGKQKNNTTGYKGVVFDARYNKWAARIYINVRLKGLGYYSSPELASESYQSFAKLHHGEFYHG